MADALVKKEVGRPTKYSEEIVIKLESILKIGGTIEDACSYALISKETYYRWLEESLDFMTRMDSAKRYPDIAAKNTVVDSIVKDKDVNSAKWWLEKRRPQEFGQMPSLTQINVSGGEKVEFILDENQTT